MPEKKIKRRQNLILRILKDADRPLRSREIAEQLCARGNEISERTVRFYLKKLDQEALTKNLGKRGRQITENGLNELSASRIIERVGFLSAKIDQMTFGMNFDLNSKSGKVVINITIAKPEQIAACIDMIAKIFADGYAMGNLMTILGPGEHLGSISVPESMVAIGTVCSITLNGVLLKYGIPMVSRFGGLLELCERKPTRFVEIINYDGTSIDPLEVFIRSGMTNYLGAIRTGNGRIGASFREFPADGRDLVVELAQRLEENGLGGFMNIGYAGQPLLEIPVSEGRAGAVVIGGLNPLAILEETGARVYSYALAGLIDYTRLFHYTELGPRLKAFMI